MCLEARRDGQPVVVQLSVKHNRSSAVKRGSGVVFLRRPAAMATCIAATFLSGCLVEGISNQPITPSTQEPILVPSQMARAAEPSGYLGSADIQRLLSDAEVLPSQLAILIDERLRRAHGATIDFVDMPGVQVIGALLQRGAVPTSSDSRSSGCRIAAIDGLRCYQESARALSFGIQLPQSNTSIDAPLISVPAGEFFVLVVHEIEEPRQYRCSVVVAASDFRIRYRWTSELVAVHQPIELCDDPLTPSVQWLSDPGPTIVRVLSCNGVGTGALALLLLNNTFDQYQLSISYDNAIVHGPPVESWPRPVVAYSLALGSP